MKKQESEDLKYVYSCREHYMQTASLVNKIFLLTIVFSSNLKYVILMFLCIYLHIFCAVIEIEFLFDSSFMNLLKVYPFMYD